MNTHCLRTFLVIMSIQSALDALSDFAVCHDDFSLKPPDGWLKKNTFSWLGFLQYVQVINGIPHQSKAPRVVLIQKQFIIGTALDMLQLPRNYKMGNVIFGEYDREEKDCGITLKQMKKGEGCAPAYLEIPLMDITPHPEFTSFGVGNSLALGKLIRPIKSRYMVPICMPSIEERSKKRRNKFVFMVDYMSSVPRDFDKERMAKKTLKMYTHRECRVHRERSKLSSEGLTNVLCSTGCGIRLGAPIVSQDSEGAFELMGIAVSGTLCVKRSHRRRLNKEPPMYIDVYPYSSWLINVITAHELPLPYPLTFRTADNGISVGMRKDSVRTLRSQKSGWRSRTFVSGNYCYMPRKKRLLKAAFIYKETFEVKAHENTRLTVNMQISAGIDCTIVCARLRFPSRQTVLEVNGVGGYNISVNFTTDWFPTNFHYSLGLMGKNTSQSNLAAWASESNVNKYW